MKISIIIPTYNESDVIVDCLKSLEKQTLRNFEVIVVDDGSTDKTLQVLSDLRFKNYDLRILKQEHKGPGAGRNLGVKHAIGEILVFVDADMTFNKNFLKNLIKPIVAEKTRGTFSKFEYVSNWDNVWARCWNINKNWEPRRRHPKNYADEQEVFRAILKSEFDRVGGFTPGGYNDDWSLYFKLGYKAISASGAVFFHKNPSSLKEAFNHAKWVSKREYKLGLVGRFLALVRVCLPVSLLLGIYKATVNWEIAFLPFKIIYDLGEFIGILNYTFTKKGAK